MLLITTPSLILKRRRTFDLLGSAPDALTSPNNRVHLYSPEQQASIEFQPPVIPHSNPDRTAKELFYHGIQVAAFFFLTNYGSVEAANNEKHFHECVRGELGLEMNYETGEAFEKAVILDRGALAGFEKKIKIESLNS
jgi:hypothetical protein